MCANSLLFCLLHALLAGIASSVTQLYCQNNSQSYSISKNIQVEVKSLAKFGLNPAEPCAYDYNGKCHTATHLSDVSRSRFFCSFVIRDGVITNEGSLFEIISSDALLEPSLSSNKVSSTSNNQIQSASQITFDHETISGTSTSYDLTLTAYWNKVIAKAGSKYRYKDGLPSYDMVVPLRMPWDDCFNHLSFQIMPMIGTVYTFYRPIWDQLTFHTSMFSAALINLLGVPMDRLIIEKTIRAKQLLVPWIPKWIPVQNPTMFNISSDVSRLISYNLMHKEFDEFILQSLIPLRLNCLSHPEAKYEDFYSLSDPFKYVIYNTREGQDTRDVYKEKELLDMINKVIDKSKYRLIVVGHSHGYKSIEQLQASWARFAKVLSKAIVMIGPHGGTSNNVMFTPSDCHIVEFNHFPEEKYVIGTRVRSVFANAHFARGGSGKYYNIEPNNKTSVDKPDMYFEGWMKVSQRDVLLTLMQINKDIPSHDLLDKNINVRDVPPLSKEDLLVPVRKTKEQKRKGVEFLGPDSKPLAPKGSNVTEQNVKKKSNPPLAGKTIKAAATKSVRADKRFDQMKKAPVKKGPLRKTGSGKRTSVD